MSLWVSVPTEGLSPNLPKNGRKIALFYAFSTFSKMEVYKGVSLVFAPTQWFGFMVVSDDSSFVCRFSAVRV